jgi:hydrogenase large subunit
MSQRITIDPITRIEGHLRIDCEVEGGKVSKAWSSGTMWRGIENILIGRDPREAWIFAQRICGVCTTVHSLASVRAVENALGLEIPANAQLIRNMIVIAHALHDHIVHFYQLSALDWVDVVSALKADAAKAAQVAQSLSDWPGNSVQEMKAVQAKLKDFVGKGQLGIFTNGYWGHPAMKLPPEVNLLAVAHYLQALEYQRKALKAVAVLGSKTPNIQNLAVGGVMNAVNMDAASTLNMNKLFDVRSQLEEVVRFVQQVYFPDVAAIGGMYAEWLGYGAGVKNYMAVPDLPTDAAATKFDMPGGILMGGDLTKVRPITSWKDDFFAKNVTEDISHAWYDGDWAKHPYKETTDPKFTGIWKPESPAPAKYTWVKAPRLDGKPMQVGPLAQVLVAYVQGDKLTQKWANRCLEVAGGVAKAKLGPAALQSTLGRIAARAIRAAVMSDLAIKHWELLANNVGKGDTAVYNEPRFPTGTLEGFGVHEAPRGVLSHWVVIENGKLKNYQAVVPSTWNAGPRDAQDQLGPYEASLVGNPMADPHRPLEALRTVHSFDPCLACAIHTHDAGGNEIAKAKVL